MKKLLSRWVPDLPDNRDFKYKRGVKKLPLKVDLRKVCSAIEDQGELGSCTGHAISSGIESEIVINKFRNIQISRLFIYFQERKIEGTISSDAGASIRDGVKACATIGACNETYWPYDPKRFKLEPSSSAYADASGRKLSKYERVNGLAGMLDCLASGHPVIFGFTVYSSFMSDDLAKRGIMSYPKKSEKCEGGHAVLAVGYDQKSEMVLVKNSWGTSWGMLGYFWMPYKVISNRNMSDDFWTVRL